jgi:ubiquinone/menaquinone biosynthesis C-methylase UbiE
MKSHEYERNYALEKHYWWFAGVRSIVRELLALAVPGGRLGRVLDVGCGTGALLDDLTPRAAEVWGVDIAEEALAFCRARGHENLVRADATHLDFPDQRFDVITAIGVIEHLEDDRAFLREMRRLLVPGGSLILLTSSFPFLWSVHDVANEHRKRYYLTELRGLTAEAGFEEIRASHINFLLFPALAPALIGHRLMRGLDQATPRRLLPEPPAIVNAALTRILAGEGKLIRRLSLPWGVSMVGAFRRPS